MSAAILSLFSVLLTLRQYQCAPYPLTSAQEIYVLAEQDQPSSVTITCTIHSTITASTIRWHHNDQDITVDNQKYELLSITRLKVNRITAADEGTYSCSYTNAGARVNTDLACVIVFGAARFDSGITSTMDAFQGESVDLDTRIVYIGAGASNTNQTITLLQLFKLDSTNGVKMNLVYFCNNEGTQKNSVCPSNDKVTATQGSHKFNLTLTLNNLTIEDGGEYCVRVEVLQPGVSSRSYIAKHYVIEMYDSFELNVIQEKNSLQCEASISGVDLSYIQLMWKDSEGNSLSSNPNFNVTSTISGEKILLIATFDVLAVEMVGQYVCTASLNQGTSTINKEAAIHLSFKDNSSLANAGMFRIAIGPVSSIECSLWYDRDLSFKMAATIREGFAAAVSGHCNCTIKSSDFSVGQFHCAGEWLHILGSVQKAQKKEVVLPAIDEWLSSAAPTITMGVFKLQVKLG